MWYHLSHARVFKLDKLVSMHIYIYIYIIYNDDNIYQFIYISIILRIIYINNIDKNDILDNNKNNGNNPVCDNIITTPIIMIIIIIIIMIMTIQREKIPT